MARAALRIPTPRLRLVPPRLPRVPQLDADDALIVGRIVVYSVMAIWVAAVIALAFGLAVRMFTLASGL